MTSGTTTGLLKIPAYLVVLITRVVSSCAIWIDFVLIFSLASYFWHSTPTTVGATAALYGLPGLLIGPFIGRLADRTSPVKVLYISYVARGLTSIGLAFAPSWELFLLFVFFKGVSNLAATPAEQILLKLSLKDAQIASGVSFLAVVDQVVKIGAPLIAATMAQFFFAQSGFLFSAVLAIIGMLILLMFSLFSKAFATAECTVSKPIRFRLLLATIHKNFFLKLAFYVALTQSLILGIYDPLLALLLKQLGFTSGSFGVIVSCTASGGIIGAIIFRKYLSSFNPIILTAASLCGFGFTVFVPGAIYLAGFTPPMALLCFLWVFNGAFYAISALFFVTTMQKQCAVEIIGTVSASARSIMISVMVIGPIIGSWLASFTSIGFVFFASGFLAISSGICLLISPRFKSVLSKTA
ncbi:MFS transporter [Pseudomonas syringae group genomosp. 3]|uniref:MFS transporter n=1 Tax=Pseudomonas syringae group genomosp. 3 TaxID=251701 RepID=UPI00070E0847|nr:MFS transporter [Pseudomonas syringae group genomosp. 3]